MPKKPRGAQLRGLHEEVHADGEEEGQTSREIIDVHPARDRGANVFAPVGQRICQLLHEVRPRLLHVVAGDRDGVEPRHLFRCVFDDVRDDPHRRFRRIDIGVADHEFLEDVVLDRARQHGPGMALFFTRNDEVGEDRDDRAVHGHAHAHLIKRDAVEQDLHVFDAVDGDARLAHVADDARMIAVIAPVGRQVEGDGHALLPGGKVLAVEGIRFLGGGKTRILPDGPGATGIHRRTRPAGKGRKPRQRPHMRKPGGVGLGIDRLHPDPFQRVPGQFLGRPALQFLAHQRAPVLHAIRHPLALSSSFGGRLAA